jgi:putative membrane protein (TIGR04086 family)
MLNYLKYLGYIFVSIILGTIFLTILNYFGIINANITKVLKIILIIISTFIPAYLLGKVSKSKGYIEGLKLGTMFVFLLIIFNLVFSSFKWSILLYFLIILFTSIFGSMLGINRKTNNK